MTREEQIRKKAKELGQQYFPDSLNIWARSNVEACYVENACVEMAEWLDQHPHWIPVEKELPKEENAYLVSDGDGVLYGYFIEGRWAPTELNETCTHWMQLPAAPVTHWMPLPQPPRKEEDNE